MRSPICAFLGHVDAGKTSIMDSIRDTFFAYKESGGLTQNIGSTEVPTERINELSADLLKRFNIEVKVPSIIFIDSPGHEAFVTLRERGASVADLAILTIDVNAGIQQQTLESIDILKSYKTPFIIALTKIDRIKGYIPQKDISFLDFIKAQNNEYVENLDKKVYDLIADLSINSLQAERYDRVKDFTKEFMIVPVSAVNNIGIMDLLIMIIGLSQRYISLEAEKGNYASILEEKSVKGVGKIYDAIIYSGTLKVGDSVITLTPNGPEEDKIKGIMVLIPLEESRENFGKYESVKEVSASKPIRLILQNSNAMAGASLASFSSEDEKKRILEEISESSSGYNNANAEGLVVCADSIGSIEAIRKIAASKGIKIGKTKIGGPSKDDVSTAKVNGSVILCFNVACDKKTESIATMNSVSILISKSIYELFERYSSFSADKSRMELEGKLKSLTLPGKIIFLKGDIFRRSNPCVFGVEVLGGEIRPGYVLIKSDGTKLGRIENIQSDGINVDHATMGQKMAISVDGAVYGRNLSEGDELFNDISIEDVIKFSELADKLPKDYLDTLAETRKIKRL
ncbi:MAG: translation initiation factor IF-2 [Candidatus Parvarchaeota archaeon]|jgi:translation initiation factor 5B|nr:translation initiation factor IF-2 [Candidatus Parvarchaeota archaeon]